MNLLDLCSGGGGFHLSAEMAGIKFEHVFYSDINEYANKVYQSRFPSAKPLGDMRRIRADKLPKGRYFITAGFPCQPFSVAGAQAGANDERYLWHEVLRLARELKPDGFIFENVAGIESVPFTTGETGVDKRRRLRNRSRDYYEAVYSRQDELQLAKCLQDLEEASAVFQTFDIPAIGVNAWHRRRRIWIIGSFTNFMPTRRPSEFNQEPWQKQAANSVSASDFGSNSNYNDSRQFQPQGSIKNLWQWLGNGYQRGNSDADGGRYNGSVERAREVFKESAGCNANDSDTDNPGSCFGRPEKFESSERGDGKHLRFKAEKHNSNNDSDITGKGFKGSGQNRFRKLQTEKGKEIHDRFEFSDSEFGDADSDGERRQESLQSRFTCESGFRDRFINDQWRRHWFEAAAELCGSDDELSSGLDVARLRADLKRLYPTATEKDIKNAIKKLISQYRRNRIELLGNSIVPAIPKIFFEIFKELLNL